MEIHHWNCFSNNALCDRRCGGVTSWGSGCHYVLCILMSTYYFSLWQAVWRGYILRVRLEQALEFAKFEDEDDFDFQEVDLKDFNFNEVCGLHTAQLETCCFLRQSVFLWICIHIYVTFYLLSMINANFNIVYKPSFFWFSHTYKRNCIIVTLNLFLY